MGAAQVFAYIIAKLIRALSSFWSAGIPACHERRSVAQACRFFDEGHDPVYFQQGPRRHSAAAIALGCLERFGNRSDLGRVRPLTLGGDLASSALRTLRKLDTAV